VVLAGLGALARDWFGGAVRLELRELHRAGDVEPDDRLAAPQ